MLLQAGLALASELSLPAVLQRIVDLAAEVAEARYGALGVLGPDGSISDFITTGLTLEERALLGPLPHGLGILGALITDARPLRLKRLSDDPRSVGFPPHHPPMSSFLGAPVKALGRVYGNIYLTEKRGNQTFTQEDEHDLVALAAHAGVAIANASLYDQSLQRERWLQGLREITEAILEGTPTTDVVHLICRQARELSGADLATVVIRSSRPGILVISAADGLFEPDFVGLELPESGSVSGEVMRTGKPILLENARTDERAFQPMVTLGRMGSSAFLPLRVGDQPYGTLAIAHGDAGHPFSEDQIRLARTFADQASVAMEYGRVRIEAERLAILDDRERIAKDLHDGIIQSLFAVGMGLQGAAAMSTDSRAAERIEGAVDEIDRVIRDLRNYIFGLRPGILADRQLDQALRQLAQELAERAAIPVEVAIDANVAAELASKAADVVQIAREALSNASRHARSGRIQLRLSREGRAAILKIEDDGSGFDPRSVAAGQGLANLRARAAALGGSTRVTSTLGKGTKIRVQLPL